MLDSAESDHRFPCEQCGADLRFSPGGDKLVCDHCGFEKPLENRASAAPIREIALEVGLQNRDAIEFEETRVLSCENCGAQVEFDENVHAAECPFCASPVVTSTGTHRHIKPRGVIPFALCERDAHGAMTSWLGRLWFAPNGLTKYARKGRRMEGIYVPFWTFDADTKTHYTGQRGTVYTETRTVRRGNETRQEVVRKIRWKAVSGRVARFFDDVLILAARSLPKTFTDALQPWDLSALEPYTADYLAGFRAEGYTITLEDGLSEARAVMDAQIARDVRFDIGGDRQQIATMESAVSDVTFKHILLPVWVAAYRYRGKSYRFVVNGQTGRVQGERPWSAFKIAIAVIVVALIAAAIGYGMAMNEAQFQTSF
ncbi:MAG: TFIIB-type zinc finger domain-containing protein [Pseudomonadota bacterium]